MRAGRVSASMSQRHAFPRRTPVTFVITLLSVATILAGCGFTDTTGSPPEALSAEDDRPEDDRVDGDRADDDPRLGGHEVVWQVHPPLGLVPVTVAQTAVPTVTVYGDGLVLMADGVDHSATGRPVELRSARLGGAALRALLERADASDVFARPAPDFGHLAVTDLGETVLVFRTSHGEVVHRSVYGLGVERYAGEDLSPEQRELRIEFQELIAEARADVGETTRYEPPRVEVNDLSGRGQDLSGGRRWPGPPFSELFRGTDDCAVVHGDVARTVFAAALDNPGIRWTAEGETRELVVRTLVPGQQPCQ